MSYTVEDWIRWANEHKEAPDIYGRNAYDFCTGKTIRTGAKRYEFSVCEYHPDFGICEFVYSYRYTKRYGFAIMLFLAFSEKADLPPLVRNVCRNGYGNFIFGHYGESRRNYWSLVDYQEDLDIADDWAHNIHYEVTTTAEDLIALDPSLKYSGYPGYCSPSAWVKQYRAHPLYEMLGKLCIYHLTEPVLNLLEKDKSFRKYIFKYAREVRSSSRGSWLIHAYNKGVSPELYSTARINKSKRTALYHEIEAEPRAALELYHSKEETLAYYDRLVSSNILNSYSGMRTLNDYYKALVALKVDLKNTRVAYPKSEEFMDRHDEAVALQKETEEKELRHGIIDTAKQYLSLEGQVRGLLFVIAKSQKELEAEGTALNHCVGRMGYGAKMAAGKTMIVFCRKAEEPDTPFVTLEVGIPDLKLIQCHGRSNCSVPEAEVAFELLKAKFKKERAKKSA